MSSPSTSQADQNNKTQEPNPNAQNFGDLTLSEAVNLLNVYVNIINQQSKQLQKCDDLRIYDQNVKQAQQQHITHLCKVVEGCKCDVVSAASKNALNEELNRNQDTEQRENDNDVQPNENLKCEPVQITLEHLDKYPILDTVKLTEELVKFLDVYQINLEEYAESYLGIARESAAAFFESPKPWIVLTFSERAPFIRIKMFLDEVESVKNGNLPAIVQNPPEVVGNGQLPLPDAISNVFSEALMAYRLNESQNQPNWPNAPPVESNLMQTPVIRSETEFMITKGGVRKRRRVEAREQAIIQAEYEKNGKPTGKRRAELAKELNLSAHTVKKWFDKIEQAKQEEVVEHRGNQLANFNNNLNLLTQLQNFPNFAYYLPSNISHNFQ
uniref:One cut domain family member n=1 Tax=Panagrellus redivivus TaxID=6233 RepID=A0A7E4W2M3_PANRE